jgi:hypothetical protein
MNQRQAIRIQIFLQGEREAGAFWISRTRDHACKQLLIIQKFSFSPPSRLPVQFLGSGIGPTSSRARLIRFSPEAA